MHMKLIFATNNHHKAEEVKAVVSSSIEIITLKEAGIDIDALAAQLQDEGARSFVKSWNELMEVIESKSAAIGKTAPVAS